MKGALSGSLVAALLLAAALAGCAGTKDPATAIGSANGTASTPAVPPSASNVRNGTAAPLVLHELTLNAAATSPGFVGPTPACTPTDPGNCGVALGQPIIPSSSKPFNGTFFDHAHFYAGAFVAQQALTGVFVYTGSIEGCTGSGTATFPWVAELDQGSPVAPNPSGEVVHGHDYLSAPTNTTGFARIADAVLDYEYDINPVTGVITRGAFTGTISCE